MSRGNSPENSNGVDLSNSSIHSMGDNSTISTVDELEGINEDTIYFKSASFFSVMAIVSQSPNTSFVRFSLVTVHYLLLLLPPSLPPSLPPGVQKIQVMIQRIMM